jgi:predicted enzyme related to lactoylglutathione lyase
MKNSVIHFEMPYDDRERMAKFYQSAFDWKTQMLGAEMGNYVLATTVESDAQNCPQLPGAINGGFYPRDPAMPAQAPSLVIAVEDIQAAMKNIRAAGGELLGDPMDIPGVGTYVSFYDTEKNRVSVLQPLPMKKP